MMDGGRWKKEADDVGMQRQPMLQFVKEGDNENCKGRGEWQMEPEPDEGASQWMVGQK